MAFSETTKPTVDGAGATFNQVAIDKTGGGGPFLPASVRARFDGALVQSEWVHAAQAGGIVNSTTGEVLAAAPGGSLRNYITGIDLSATALTTATEIVVRESGGAILWRSRIGVGGLDLRPVRFDPPLKAASAVAVEAATLTAAGASSAVYVNASGFVAA